MAGAKAGSGVGGMAASIPVRTAVGRVVCDERRDRDPRIRPPPPRRRRLRRPQHRARDLLRLRRQRAGGDRPRPLRRRAGRHLPRRPLGAGRRRAGEAGHHRRRAARGRRPRARRSCCPATPPTAAWWCTSPARCPAELGEVDVVLPLLHGPYGEDGTIQGLLELAGVPYVGSGVFASAAAMDKGHMKTLLQRRRAARRAVRRRHRRAPGPPTRPRSARPSRRCGYPVFVKPARAGSSVGITKVHAPAELDDAIEAGPRARPEGARRGDARGPRDRVRGARGPRRRRRPRRASRARSWSAATTSSTTSRPSTCPTRAPSWTSRPTCPDAVVAEVQALAAQAFEALSCEGLARVDFFVTRDGRVVSTRSTRCRASRRSRCSR